MRSVGLVVIHGVGRQKPGETVALLRRAFTSSAAVGARHGILAGRRPAADAAAASADPEVRLALEIETPAGAVLVRLYEAYWADLATATGYTSWETIRYRLWLLWTLAYPLRNYVGRRYRPVRLPLLTFLRSFAYLAATGVVAHVADLLLRLALGAVGREKEINRVILEYGGDVYRYVTPNRRRSRAQFLGRVRDAVARAASENTEVQILGHSLGSVIAYDALTRRELSAQEMARLTVLHTWGSPLDKFYFVWPQRLEFELAPPPPRPLRWINWHIGRDPIGGILDFFGGVQGLVPPENLRSAGPGGFASAHTDYWENPQVIRSLLDALGLGAGH